MSQGFQQAEDGYPVGADQYLREAYGKIPGAKLFQHPRNTYEEPVRIIEWRWSVTFGQWGALIEFSDGWRGFTWPKPSS